MKKILNQLKAKAENKGRMPSLIHIHQWLNSLNIPHWFNGEVTNIVEYRTGGKTYVNSRHDGKIGKKIVIKKKNLPEELQERLDCWELELDSSDSYYSWNTSRYAERLVKLVDPNYEAFNHREYDL